MMNGGSTEASLSGRNAPDSINLVMANPRSSSGKPESFHWGGPSFRLLVGERPRFLLLGRAPAHRGFPLGAPGPMAGRADRYIIRPGITECCVAAHGFDALRRWLCSF